MFTPSCPHCGGPLGAAERQHGDQRVDICEHCRAVVVSGKVRGRKQSDAEVDWVHAICCRLCGGALPEEEAAKAEHARCVYCGHRARMRPGIASALRVLFTDPRLLPSSVRQAAFFSLAVILGSIVLAAYGVWWSSGLPALADVEIPADQVTAGGVLFDDDVLVPPFSDKLKFRFDIDDTNEGRASLLVVMRHAASRTCQGYPIHVNPNRVGGFHPEEVELKWALPPPGPLHVRVEVSEVERQIDAPIRMRIVRWGGLPLLYLIVLLNVLCFLTLANMYVMVDLASTRRTSGRVLQAVAVVFLVYWIGLTVFGYDPLAPTDIEAQYAGTTGCDEQ